MTINIPYKVVRDKITGEILSRYGLTDAPREYIDAKNPKYDTTVESVEHPYWSSTKPVPGRGEKVHVDFNGEMVGTVLGYFVELGWLGFYFLPDEKPAWFDKRADPSHPYTMCFGNDLDGGVA